MTRHELHPVSPTRHDGRSPRPLLAVIAGLAFSTGVWCASAPTVRAADAGLLRTPHPPVPTRTADAWFVPPGQGEATIAEKVFLEGLARFREEEYGRAIQALTDKRLAGSPLAPWGVYYAATAHAKAGRFADAVRLLEPLMSEPPDGVVAELGARLFAEAAEAAGDLPRSLATFTALSERPTAAPDEILKRLAEVASKAGEGGRARAAWLRVYYEYPLSPHAGLAEPVAAEARVAAGAAAAEVLARDLARAEAMFAAKRYADARPAFERLLAQASGETREVAELRMAECDYFAGKYRVALEKLEPWLERGSRKAEARFFTVSALRRLGRDDEFVTHARALVADFPETTWAEDALNDLATHYILENDDATADAVFTEILTRFPEGRHAPRAAWKHGWWQYKLGDFASAATVFEAAATRHPRSDYRPSWIYWAGRAREQAGDVEAARTRFEIVFADYRHSYYGRLASDRLPTAPGPARSRLSRAAAADAVPAAAHVTRPPADLGDSAEAAPAEPAAAPGNRAVVERLLVLGLWDEALLELQYAQRAWGKSAAIEATMAWVYARQGDLRRGINAMKRAYPQYMSDGGERLPREIVEVIFPMAYWDLIRKYSVARRLDPHVVAALIAQESTFERGAKSAANAWGLMQIVPSTGRRLARAEGIRRFSTTKLTDPETNVRLGTRYFASLIDRFGGVHYALASYNAGESRVVRWRAERPGVAQEEFIDDIPFPETQNYVKKILGTADDYRWLYPVKR